LYRVVRNSLAGLKQDVAPGLVELIDRMPKRIWAASSRGLMAGLRTRKPEP